METPVIVNGGSVTDAKGYRWLYDIHICDVPIKQGLEDSEAREFVADWNKDIDTLKALLDEAIATLETFKNTDRYKDSGVDTLIAKAKALK